MDLILLVWETLDMPVIEYFKLIGWQLFYIINIILSDGTGKAKSCDSNNFTSEMESPRREISVALE